uniref:Uncharacterized protein n=1 Tax=Oryza sativa subsp. japonica TaxID=39947 RepID=Q6Z655_ORYSJ|nr:hypothetical protein [Oryza sativa Japonica Group]
MDGRIGAVENREEEGDDAVQSPYPGLSSGWATGTGSNESNGSPSPPAGGGRTRHAPPRESDRAAASPAARHVWPEPDRERVAQFSDCSGCPACRATASFSRLYGDALRLRRYDLLTLRGADARMAPAGARR